MLRVLHTYLLLSYLVKKHAFVLWHLDYGNSSLAGLPKSMITPLQRVENTATRLIMNIGPRDYVSSALKQLHWLPVRCRVCVCRKRRGAARTVVRQLRAMYRYQSSHDVPTLGGACHVRLVIRRTSIALTPWWKRVGPINKYTCDQRYCRLVVVNRSKLDLFSCC